MHHSKQLLTLRQKKRTINLLTLLVVQFLFLITPGYGQNVVRGPYLQQNAPTSIIIKWRTSSAESSRVKTGIAANHLATTHEDATSTTEHEIKIDGLQPDTKYYYQIGSQTSLYATSDQHYFRTAPATGSHKAFRTWFLGDPGTRSYRQHAVRDGFLTYANSTSPDLMMLLGDNAYNDGTDEEYQGSVFENMYENILINTPLWSSTGNHDLAYGYAHVFYNIFSFPTQGEMGGVPSNTEGYYSFDYANVHFVALESTYADKSTDGAMANWLRKDLAASTQTWKIVVLHHPLYSSGHDSDKESGLIKLRENFAPIIEQYGVDLVVYGHSHRYERTPLIRGHYGLSHTWDASTMAVDNGWGRADTDGVYKKTTTGAGSKGTVYITTGCAGKNISGDPGKPVHKITSFELGSGVLDIDGMKLNFKQINDKGEVVDYFTIQKTKGDDTGDGGQDLVTVVTSISSGNNDVEENSSGNINFSSSDLEMVYDYSSLQTIGLRFENLQVPQGATITGAYLKFSADESNSKSTALEIMLHKHANSPEFSNANNVTSRTVLNHKVEWLPTAWTAGNKGDAQRSPNLKALLQLLINNPDWKAGNDLSFIIKGKGASLTDIEAKRVASAFESGTDKAAQLVVTYTEQPVIIDTDITITSAISAGNNDVEEDNNGRINFSSSDLEMALDYTTLQTIGLRFDNINLPKDAEITQAYLQFSADESNNTAATLEIALHDHANSPVFSNTNKVASRTTLSNKVTWLPAAWTATDKGNAQRSPELKALVQNIVNKDGWQPGNSLSFIIKGKGASLTDSEAKRVAGAYESSADKATRLVITYKTTENQRKAQTMANDKKKADPTFRVYPNPFLDKVFIESQYTEPLYLSIATSTGKIVFRQTIKPQQGKHTIYPGIKQSGSYIFYVTKGNKQLVAVRQFIKK